jgi:hypothetical protein
MKQRKYVKFSGVAEFQQALKTTPGALLRRINRIEPLLNEVEFDMHINNQQDYALVVEFPDEQEYSKALKEYSDLNVAE